MTKLKGKVALITGSGRGIGRAIALKLASEGAKVVVNDLDAAPGDAVAAEIKAAGGEAIAVNGSVSEEGFAERFVGAAMGAFGGLDIIVQQRRLYLGRYDQTQPVEAQQKTIDVAGRDIKVGVQPQMLDTMSRMIPLGRGGTPEEAADDVYLFCSPESNYISGQVVVCGGGLLI
jgi:NAD(P)-dependent dehydrogenase (short-subunit alcohol dehydrogenase family)